MHSGSMRRGVPMKPWFVTTAICFAIGATLNVVVSLFLAVAAFPLEGGRLLARESVSGLWKERLGDTTRYDVYRGYEFVGLGASELVLTGGRPIPGDYPEPCSIHILDAGFPMHSLRGETWRFDGSERTVHAIRVAAKSVRSGRQTSLLPLVPLWPGFLVNSLVYAAFGWVVLLGCRWFEVRRRRHRKAQALVHRRCPRCAYDISHLPHTRCPECGETWSADERRPEDGTLKFVVGVEAQAVPLDTGSERR